MNFRLGGSLNDSGLKHTETVGNSGRSSFTVGLEKLIRDKSVVDTSLTREGNSSIFRKYFGRSSWVSTESRAAIIFTRRDKKRLNLRRYLIPSNSQITRSIKMNLLLSNLLLTTQSG